MSWATFRPVCERLHDPSVRNSIVIDEIKWNQIRDFQSDSIYEQMRCREIVLRVRDVIKKCRSRRARTGCWDLHHVVVTCGGVTCSGVTWGEVTWGGVTWIGVTWGGVTCGRVT